MLFGSFYLLTIVSPAPCRAQDSEALDAAALHFELGLQHSDNGNYDAAVQEFQSAYERAPNFVVLYNLGLAYLHLNQHVRALESLERYVAEGGDLILPERLEAVNAEILRLRGLVGHIMVETDSTTEAEIHLNGRRVGSAPLPEPVAVENRAITDEDAPVSEAPSGPELSLSRETLGDAVAGHNESTSDRGLEIGDTVGRDIQPASNRNWRMRLASFIVGGLGIALLVTATTLELWNQLSRYPEALDEQDELLSEYRRLSLNTSLQVPDDLLQKSNANAELQHSIQRLDVTTKVLFGIGGASLITGLILYFLAPRQARGQQMSVALHPTGVELVGIF